MRYSLVTQTGGVDHILPHSPIQMRESLRTRPKPHLRTQVISSTFTFPTILASDSDLHRYPITDLESGCSGLVGS